MATKKYLDETGVTYLWSKIKNKIWNNEIYYTNLENGVPSGAVYFRKDVSVGNLVIEGSLQSGDGNTYFLPERTGTIVVTDGVDGTIPAQYLPSYVDDVLEYVSKSNFPSQGETGKIYVALDTNLTYRWSGTQYVEISKSLALGETSSTAYPGDKGALLYSTLNDLISNWFLPNGMLNYYGVQVKKTDSRGDLNTLAMYGNGYFEHETGSGKARFWMFTSEDAPTEKKANEYILATTDDIPEAMNENEIQAAINAAA